MARGAGVEAALVRLVAYLLPEGEYAYELGVPMCPAGDRDAGL